MNNRFFVQRSRLPWLPFLICVIAAVMLMLWSMRQPLLRHALHDKVLVSRLTLSTMIDRGFSLFYVMETEAKLQEDNNRLQANLLSTQATVQQLQSQIAENAELRNLLSLKQSLPISGVAARVISAVSNPFVVEYVLDKGLAEGLHTGSAVMDAKGVLGQITEVTEYSARVMLLTHKKSAIPVKNVRSHVEAIAYGNGHQGLMIETIPGDIQSGDLWVTSGMGRVYPAGLRVGTVTTVRIEGPFLKVLLTPLSAMTTDTFVFVLGESHVA